MKAATAAKRICRKCGESRASAPVGFRICSEGRWDHGTCRQCENAYRAAYHKAHRERCIAASVKANRQWRKRSVENWHKTQEWNRISVERRALRLKPRHQHNMRYLQPS